MFVVGFVVCPIMTSEPDKYIECVEDECGCWNKEFNCCGFTLN